jgi:hypothetical protein
MSSPKHSVPLDTFIKVATEHYVQFPNERTALMLIQMASKIQESEIGDRDVSSYPEPDEEMNSSGDEDDSDEEMNSSGDEDDSDEEMDSSDDDSDEEMDSSDDDSDTEEIGSDIGDEDPMDTSHSPHAILLSDDEKEKIYFTHFTQNASDATLAAWEFARRSIDGCGRVKQSVMLTKFTNDEIYELLRTNEVYDEGTRSFGPGKKIGLYSVADYYCKDEDGADIELQLKPYFR